MNKKIRVAFFVLLILGVGLAAMAFLLWPHMAVLQPKGPIAAQERDLMNIAGLLSLVVIVPVFAMTFFIVWKYRASNKKARHSPDWDHNTLLESIWWGIPCAIILVLAALTWHSSHALDPYKKLDSTKALTVQVVALQWKWLFIYPEQHIATVNFVQFPEDTPINFRITADAPMNSFWIPQLGGQVYAMSGMETKLHLEASETGIYRGSSANISGAGFAGMTFQAKASSEADFQTWVESVRHVPAAEAKLLDQKAYDILVKPSENNPVAYYSSTDEHLYGTIMEKFMGPEGHKDMKMDQDSPAMQDADEQAHERTGHMHMTETGGH